MSNLINGIKRAISPKSNTATKQDQSNHLTIPSPRKKGNLVIRSNDQGETSQSQSQAGISSVINEGEGNKLGTQGSGHSGSDKDDVSLESYDTVEDKMSHYDKKSMTSSDSQPSPCGRCRRLVHVSDHALECEICLQWFHISCEHVNKTQYKCISDSSRGKGKNKSKVHWYCNTCDLRSTRFMRSLASLHHQQQELCQKLDEVVRDREKIMQRTSGAT